MFCTFVSQHYLIWLYYFCSEIDYRRNLLERAEPSVRLVNVSAFTYI